MLRMARDKEAGGDVGGNERERGRARVMRGHGGCCALRRKDGDDSWWKNCDALWWWRTWYWMVLWWVVTEELWYILVMTDVALNGPVMCGYEKNVIYLGDDTRGTEWSCDVWLWKIWLWCTTVMKYAAINGTVMRSDADMVMKEFVIYCGDVIRSNMWYCDMWWCRHKWYGDEELWGCGSVGTYGDANMGDMMMK